jgi:hypothetical protein
VIEEQNHLKSKKIIQGYKSKQLNISDVMNRVETDQLILLEPDKIFGLFELVKKVNRKSYFLSEEEARNLADFIYSNLDVS